MRHSRKHKAAARATVGPHRARLRRTLPVLRALAWLLDTARTRRIARSSAAVEFPAQRAAPTGRQKKRCRARQRRAILLRHTNSGTTLGKNPEVTARAGDRANPRRQDDGKPALVHHSTVALPAQIASITGGIARSTGPGGDDRHGVLVPARSESSDAAQQTMQRIEHRSTPRSACVCFGVRPRPQLAIVRGRVVAVQSSRTPAAAAHVLLREPFEGPADTSPSVVTTHHKRRRRPSASSLRRTRRAAARAAS